MIPLIFCIFFFLMIRRPPSSTRTDTLFPYTTLFRSVGQCTAYRICSPADSKRNKEFDRPIRIFIRCDRHGAGSESKRSEEHTSELQSLMRISYAVFCLKKKKAT